MEQQYLREDVTLIRKYFPGAKPVVLHTPFDLTNPIDPWKLRADSFNDSDGTWYGDLAWTRL